MRKRERTALSLCLALLLLLAAGGAGTAAAKKAPEPEPQEAPVYLDGLLTCRGYTLDGAAYLSVEDICSFLGLKSSMSYEAETRQLSITAYKLELFAEEGKDYFCVNGRYLYDPQHWLLVDGRPYFSAEAVGRIFNLPTRLSEDGRRIEADSSGIAVLEGGPNWYTDHFDVNDIFWLARIIRSEAGGQPIAGRIGVGNVVLNRVASDRYPDTVHDVVFDEQFGLQFQPTGNGTVYIEPNEECLICAYLALEGYNTVGDSMYFVNPRAADDSWFQGSKEFTVRIGDHDFYSLPQG